MKWYSYYTWLLIYQIFKNFFPNIYVYLQMLISKSLQKIKSFSVVICHTGNKYTGIWNILEYMHNSSKILPGNIFSEFSVVYTDIESHILIINGHSGNWFSNLLYVIYWYSIHHNLRYLLQFLSKFTKLRKERSVLSTEHDVMCSTSAC